MANSKTSNKSTLVGKGGNSKFQADPNCPRFIPTLTGGVIYRDPETGLNRRLTLDEATELGYAEAA